MEDISNFEILDNRCNLMVNGCDLSFFPFRPHQCQEDIMKKLIEAFDNGQNCIIESPTGTGKCIASLSACVAYLNKISKLADCKKEKDHKQRINDINDILDYLKNNLSEIKKKVENEVESDSENYLNTPNEEFIKNLNLNYCIENRANLQKTLIEFFEDVCRLEINTRKVDQNLATENFENQITLLKNKFKEIVNEIKEEYKKFKYSHNVIYAIRTSSQMDVVQEELNRLPLDFKCAYLKSRDFHCLNQNVRKNFVGGVLKEKCKSAFNSCKYKNNFNDPSNKNLPYSKDLKYYKEKSTCPYYGELEKCKNASLIVCTYNYLLLPSCYKLYKEYMANPIIIIDEGHNIINSCEGCLNFSFNIKELYEGIRSLLELSSFQDNLSSDNESSSESSHNNHLINEVKEKLFDFMINLLLINQVRDLTNYIYDDFYILKILDFLFSSSTKNIDANCQFEEKSKYDTRVEFTNKYNFEETSFTFENLEIFLLQIQQIVKIFNRDLEKEIPLLEKFARFIKFTFKLIKNCKKSAQKIFFEDYFLVCNGIWLNSNIYEKFLNYKGYFQQNSDRFDLKWEEFLHIFDSFKNKTIKLICMNPAVQFDKVKKFNPRSICLVSGTIQPFEFYEKELKTEFECKLSTSHIIDKSNVNFMLFKEPLQEYDIHEKFKELKYGYEFMKKPNFKNYIFNETYDIIMNILNSGSIGNLIFMKSFKIIEEFKNFLKSAFEKLKYNVKVEHYGQELEIKNEDDIMIYKLYFDSDKKPFKKLKNQIVENYKNGCSQDIQSCFFSVMRGTLSEGVNFENKESTSLIILGIPYNDFNEESIYLKQRYLDNKYNIGEHVMKGREWYELQAMVALNQALGRAIRRKTDFATICIVDSHITRKGIHDKLSKWIKELDEKKVTKENCLLMFEKTVKFYRDFSNI
jgi:regulator of telomere elongation helicase 1